MVKGNKKFKRKSELKTLVTMKIMKEINRN